MDKKIIKAMIALCCTLLTLLAGATQIELPPETMDYIESTIAQAEQAIAPPTQEFSIYYCSKEQFISHCCAHNIRPDKIGYVWDLLRGQYTTEELAKKYCLEYDTVKRDKWKYKKKLVRMLKMRS